MELLPEQIRRVQSLSRRERVRLIRDAENLLRPGEDAFAGVDEDTAMFTQAVWHQLFAREQALLFPVEDPFDGGVPEIPEFPERVLRLRPANVLQPVLSAAATLIVVVAVFWFAGFGAAPASSYDLTGLAPGEFDTIAAPAVLHFPDATHRNAARFFEGFALVRRTPVGFEILPASLVARFELDGDAVDLSIRHTYSTLRVTGTRFSVDYRAGYGTVMLDRGSLEVRHHPYRSGEESRPVALAAPAHFVFDADELRSDELQEQAEPPAPDRGAPAGPTAVRQRFELRDGRSVEGSVLRGDEERLVVRRRDGEIVEILKRELVRSRVLKD